MDAHLGAVDAWSCGRDGASCVGPIRPIGRIGPILFEGLGILCCRIDNPAG